MILVAILAAVVQSKKTAYSHRPRTAAKTPSVRFVYVLDYSQSRILPYSVNPSTGTLIAADMGPFKAGEHPYAAATSFEGNNLYVANRGRADGVCGTGCTISAYAIDFHNGALTELDGSPYRAGSGPSSIALHPSGKYLYVVNVMSSDLLVFKRYSNGLLEPMGKPQPVGRSPFFVTATPSGRSTPWGA